MARPSSSYMQEAPPGYRWKTVTKMNAMGRPYTTRILVPIVGPETTSQVLAGMGGQEDRLGALAGADRVPPQDVTTVIKEYEDDTPNTRTTTIKGGLLDEMYDKFDPYGGVGTGGGMDDPNWSRATAVNRPPPTNLPGTDFFGGDVLAPPPPRQNMGMVDPTWSGATAVNTPRPNNLPGTDFFGGGPAAPQPTGREMIAEASKQPLYVTDDGEPIYMEDVIAVGGAARLRAISRAPSQIQEAFFKWIKRIKDSRNRSGKPPITADKPIVKTALAGGALAAGEAARRGIFRGEGEQPEVEQAVAPRVREPGDVKPTGRFPPEVIAAAQARQRDTQTPFPDRFPEEVIAGGQQRQQDAQTPFPNRFPQEVLDRRKGIQQTPFRGEGEASSQVALSPTLPSGRKKLQLPREVDESASGSPTYSKANDEVEMGDNPNLEKIWGKYAYDPTARRKFYLDNLKDIWRKALLMDVVANLTGGQSMSKRYLEMATGRLDAMEKFNEEERISNIWREVFTDANGNFYMPKTKREAAERAGKTGARPAVIKDIFGSVPDVKKKVQYHRVDPKDPTKWENKRFDPDVEPSEEWITGASRSTSPQTEDIYLGRLNKLQEMRDAGLTELANSYERMIGADAKGHKDLSPSRWSSILQGDIQGANPTIELPQGQTATGFIMKWLTQPEVEYVDPNDPDGPKKKLPGYPSLAGRKATEAEIAEATGATTATKATEGTQERLSARDRAQQLKAEGKTKEEAKEIMREEGYDIG